MKHLVSITDFTTKEIKKLLTLAKEIKKFPFQQMLSQRSMAMIFEKPSLRTRVTFEIGMAQLGGHAVYLQPNDIKLGQRETVADAARNLDRWVDIIMARTFKHTTIEELAKYSSVPVINALSDLEHPCQAMADFLTMMEHRGDLNDVTLVFVGDGNNVCNSLMLLSGLLGTNFVLTCPKGYEPKEEIVIKTKELMETNGGSFKIIYDIKDAVASADFLYTDVWVSMGQEKETDERKQKFKAYQINNELISMCKPTVKVLHCLPANRGEEITDEVMDGPHSIVFDQAENRLHAQKAIILHLLEKDHLIKVHEAVL